ncbi:MAG: hypothetical protein IJX59_03380, partial [Clostridia bacterium]|nr:hypothetical protein [Clostridia bacterium]
IREIFMPPDMHSRQKDSGLTMAELFFREGIDGSCADNRRVPGWLAIKELLRPEGEGQSPRLQIFDCCQTLISHLPSLLKDEKDGSDASVHPHEITHICDALRYFVLSYRQREQAQVQDDPLMAAKKRAIRRAAKGERSNRF